MVKSIALDARKVIKYINDSAQSNVRVVKEALSRLGEKAGFQYKLVALHPKNVMFEDVNGQYYLADYARSRGSRINFSNITQVKIEESKKSHVFNNACVDLVESVLTGDKRGAEIAFKKLESCRFRSTVTSGDGHVVTRDGTRRKFLTESPAISKDSIKTVVEAVTKVIQEDVVLEGNQVISAKIGNVDLKLPITETMRRCNIAKKMKTVAEDAWQSSKFQQFVGNVTGLISKNLIKEAVVEAAKFLKEYQEFSMLNLTEMETLVENALATINQYNPVLMENTALLLYKTNTKANKSDILSVWEKTARVASDPALLEEVYKLSKSEDFNNDYQMFLYKVLVEGTEIPQDFLKKALLLVKKVLRDAIDVSESDEETRTADNETIDAVNTALGGESEPLMAGIHKSSGVLTEEENVTIAKYKRALDEINDMIVGIDAGDPDQIRAATDLFGAIDTENIMSQETLQDYGKEEGDAGELGAGEVAEAADELEGEGEAGGEGEGEGEGKGELDLGGLGEIGLENLGGEGEEGEEGEETFGLEGEGEGEEEGGEKEEEVPNLSFEEKDAYGDYVISETQDIDDEYGSNMNIQDRDLIDSAENIVADLHSLFESEDSFASGGPLDKEEQAEGEGLVSDDLEAGTDDSKDGDVPFSGAAPLFKSKDEKNKSKDEKNKDEDEDEDEDGEKKLVEKVEDIKQKNVITGSEGVNAESGAPEDSLPKDLGGDIPGGKKLQKGGDCCPKTEPGNKGSDKDMKKVGKKGDTLKESKTKPAFGHGPFKRVK